MKQKDYFTGIDDLPLYNWIQCTSGNLTYVRRGDKGNEETDTEVWTSIYDSYISEFGLSEQYRKMLEAMKAKALVDADYIITGERFKLTEAEIFASKLQSILNNSGNGMSIDESLVHLSRWMNQWINTRSITTREYFNLLNEYGKANKVK